MSLAELGTAVAYSKSALSRIEVADSAAPPDLPPALDSVLQADGHFSRLYELARNEVHPDRYRRRMALEEQAQYIYEFSGHLVPGLVQTREYATEVITHGIAGADQAQELIEARMNRQSLLRADRAPYLWVILDEAVIRRPVGGPEVMHEQLRVLLGLVETERTVVQVLPFAHGTHPLMGGSLSVLTMPSGTSFADEESFGIGDLMDDPEQVGVRARAYDRMKAHALTPRDTATLLTSAMEDFSP